MSYVTTALALWLIASAFSTIAFCWLLKTKRISFAPIEDRNEFQHDWVERS